MASVFLAIPTYNESVHMGTMLGVMTATAKHDVRIGVRSSSLLAHGFNHLWCDAVASGCEYFAMCHADIGPSAGWLDILLDEMRAHGADMLSAVVPVKTSEGVYSTSMVEPGDMPRYRLTAEHLAQLPPTFATEDVQRVSGQDGLLCCNTGLWVCQLGEDWNRDVSFNIQSWIDWKAAPPQPLVIPEDWDFSLQLHKMGLIVMATQRVPLVHAGAMTWRAEGCAEQGQEAMPVL